jgi:hypothetical protein
MKNTRLNTTEIPLTLGQRVARNLAVTGTLAFALAVPHAIADEDYEWDSNWGLHEEEWYDPSDWFNDDDEIDYEDYGYDDNYYSDPVWDSYDYYGDYGYDYTDYDPVVTGYDYYYQWSPEDQDWTEVEGDKAESDKRSADAKKMSEDKKSKDKNSKDIDKKDVVTMRGTLQSVGKAKTKGAKKSHTFSVLDAGSGKSVLVDFGPKAQLDKIKLKKGNKIQVRGPRVKFGGRYVVVAQQVSAINPDKKD